jgi:hypothetical protein
LANHDDFDHLSRWVDEFQHKVTAMTKGRWLIREKARASQGSRGACWTSEDGTVQVRIKADRSELIYIREKKTAKSKAEQICQIKSEKFLRQADGIKFMEILAQQYVAGTVQATELYNRRDTLFKVYSDTVAAAGKVEEHDKDAPEASASAHLGSLNVAQAAPEHKRPAAADAKSSSSRKKVRAPKAKGCTGKQANSLLASAPNETEPAPCTPESLKTRKGAKDLTGPLASFSFDESDVLGMDEYAAMID